MILPEVAIVPALTDEQILATRDVMRQLRPAISEEAYLPTIRRMMDSDGYQLTALLENGVVQAVAGYRFIEMLYCGQILYVDDLNTDQSRRSSGFGKLLLDWLKQQATARGCGELHLDSGVQRERAHRFYFREQLTITAYHFRVRL